jgi:hypothetical protein
VGRWADAGSVAARKQVTSASCVIHAGDAPYGNVSAERLRSGGEAIHTAARLPR